MQYINAIILCLLYSMPMRPWWYYCFDDVTTWYDTYRDTWYWWWWWLLCIVYDHYCAILLLLIYSADDPIAVLIWLILLFDIGYWYDMIWYTASDTVHWYTLDDINYYIYSIFINDTMIYYSKYIIIIDIIDTVYSIILLQCVQWYMTCLFCAYWYYDTMQYTVNTWLFIDCLLVMQ